MAKTPGITFRRVHGRIIPIKVDSTPKARKDVAQGAALVAAGAGTSVAAGKVWKGSVQQAVKWSVKGWNGLEKALEATKPAKTLFDHANQTARRAKLLEVSSKLLTAGARLDRFAPAIRIAGIATGSALIGAGAGKVYGAFEKENKKSKLTAKAVGLGTATAAFLTGAYGAAGVRQGIKPVFKALYPKVIAAKKIWKL